MTARKGERRRELRLFLEDAFGPDDFEIVVRESHLADIASDVNAKAAGKRYRDCSNGTGIRCGPAVSSRGDRAGPCS